MLLVFLLRGIWWYQCAVMHLTAYDLITRRDPGILEALSRHLGGFH